MEPMCGGVDPIMGSRINLPLVTASAFPANNFALGFLALASNGGVAVYFGTVELTESLTPATMTCKEDTRMPNNGTGLARLQITGVARLQGTAISTGESSGPASSSCSEFESFSSVTSP